MRTLTLRRAIAASILLVATLPVSPASAATTSCTGGGDFDGDGRADLVVGAPFESVGRAARAGVVHVLHGVPTGVAGSDAVWHQQRGGVPGAAEEGDRLGAVHAAGDFDGDGYDDLAVGVPGEGISGQEQAGAVLTLMGSSSGVRAARARSFSQASRGIAGVAEAFDRFGSALAAGDFDGDGYDDLAVGIPGQRVGTEPRAGAVQILRGSPSGLTGARDRIWTLDSSKVPGRALLDAGFGSALAAGNFDGDGVCDLAIGAPWDRVGPRGRAGSVTVLAGGAGGPAFDSRWTQESTGVPARADAGDDFGLAVAAGDLNGDGADDLAIGAPGDLVSGRPAGSVTTLHGSGGGLRARSASRWHLDRAGIAGQARAGDRFASAVATGDVDGDGDDDLVVGVPLADLGARDAGAIHVLPGGARGVSAAGDRRFGQDTKGVLGRANRLDAFGASLWAGDLTGDGRTDVAIGVPREDVRGAKDAGAVAVLLGGGAGLRMGGDRLLRQGDGLSRRPRWAERLAGTDPMPGETCGNAGSGRLLRFRVQVGSGLPTGAERFRSEVLDVLCDGRSWIASDAVRFRYDPDGPYLIRVLSADETERRCMELIGLSVRRMYSCQGGREVVLNADRWFGGSPNLPVSVARYRQMLVNHEVGHLFGQRHRGCGTSGARAPVMMQQSKGTGGCRPNPWPLPYELRSV